ncbi:MAG: CoB--CoM heterodisulfide reductase iron-sulfur subunit A family protein [Desulfobacterales bacterium]|nr:CoB--CoM heterodisulfide reductase iron-sulfur subunit A family protein [Desulfobacterales bacterium]
MQKDVIGAALVVGGGVTGIQAALDLADSGYFVYLVERTSSIGGIMSQLDKTFPTNDCSMCIMSPKLVEVGRHINVELLTLSEVTGISGETGNFQVNVTQYPRYVDVSKCIACGLCAEKCPKKVPNAYEQGLINRKAIYVKFAQAVPLKYAIDADNCIYLTKGKCGNCAKVCPAGAIKYDDVKQERVLNVGTVVLAQGTGTFNPANHDTLGYKKYPNVVTSIEFERILSASGPYGGHLIRPSDKKEPQKIAWLQCIGSRDEHIGAKGYCSSVCCTHAIKQAMLAKEHSHDPLDTTIFYIDIRTYGKDFEQFYNRAKHDGVRFIKSKVTTVIPDSEDNGKMVITYIDEAGKRLDEGFDIVVLSVGLETTKEGVALAKKLGVDLNHYNYVENSSFRPVETSTKGIYVCGAFAAPKDIPSSVIDASAAAGVAGTILAKSRHTLTKTPVIPIEKDLRGDPPRIGVFLCRCGTNIAGVVDIPDLVEYSRSLPNVIYAEENMFSCSQATQDKITELIREKHLNRVVVAACTPKTHDPLFQETLVSAGINKYLFELVNIRNHCSWVHKTDPVAATQKSKDLVRMSVLKMGMLEPLTEPKLEIKQSALVIGGGVAGMEAAKNLAEQGYPTYLIEKGEQLGGQARFIHKTWKNEDVQKYVEKLVSELEQNEKIEILMKTSIEHVDGYVGNFKTSVNINGEKRILEHGVTIFACGAEELKPNMYQYGKDRRVVTGLELQNKFNKEPDSLKSVKTAVFVQCVGSRIPERPYCSKVCCTQSIKSALTLKEINPDMNIYILYRDMRPYGLREDLYRTARGKGISFIRYNHDEKMNVSKGSDKLDINFTDYVLRKKIGVSTDLLVLASAVIPEKENPLAQLYKVPQNQDGFFAEAHVKLRPVDFATDGVFVCGLAHAPKTLDESITQAQAASARAVTLLSRKIISVAGTVAEVVPANCTSCGVCISVCAYSAPRFDEKSGKAMIQSTLCKGCGVCAASCRSGAIKLKGFDHGQILSMIEAFN